ncbi:MAG: response regulator transcription factor [Patescibacteria group bacterium]
MRVLLVEDEPDLADLYLRVLKSAGYAVDHTIFGKEAIFWAKTNDYDIAQIDGRLPDVDGFTVCAEVRKAKPELPIIMTTVRNLTEDKKVAFAAGADDYLVKPFYMEELTMRYHALLRRPKTPMLDVIEYNGLMLDTRKRIVTLHGKLVDFRMKEVTLMEYMMRNLGIPLTRTMMLEHVWDMNIDPFTNTVDVHIRSMRKKLNDLEGNIIKTVHGMGYKVGD